MDLNIKKLTIHLQTNFQFFHISMTEHNHFSFKIGTCRRQWHPTPVLLPGESHGQRSLAGCSPWGREESDTTKWLHFHFSLSCIGGGNGNPFQYSCLENPRMAEPGGLPSMGSHRVGHNWSDLAAAAAAHASKVMLKILWARLQYYMNCELPDVQAAFRKVRGTRDEIANIHWIIKKA